LRSWKDRGGVSAVIALFVVIGLSARNPYRAGDQVLFRQQSIMGEVSVMDKTYFRIMLVDGAVQSWVERATMQPSGAFAQMLPLALLHDPLPKDALVIGLGAGSVSTLLAEQGLSVDTVEIDERVIEAARRYFDFAGPVARGDGRRFLREARDHTYDLIVFDISTGDAFPAYMFTKENFEQVRRVLRPRGLAVIHFAGRKDSLAVRSVKRTLRQVFGHAVAIHTGEDAMSSVVIMSSETSPDREKLRAGIQRSVLNNSLKGFYLGVLDEKWDSTTDEGIVLTDRFNPLENWQVETMEEWRRYALKVFGDLSSL
jgi:spermidine synthase